jgi:hypothetical protein
MLPKIVFDKTGLFKFKISNNFKQNIDETDSKNNQKSIGKTIPADGFEKSQEKKNPRTKSLEAFAVIFVIFNKKKSIRLEYGMDLKLYTKSIG